MPRGQLNSMSPCPPNGAYFSLPKGRFDFSSDEYGWVGHADLLAETT